MLANFFRVGTNLFPLWSVLVAVVALWWPPAFLWYTEETIPIGLGLIMLGMGLTLRVEDFQRVWKRPAAIGFGILLQFAVMPFLGWGIARSFDLPPDMAVGLILVSCCPGGTASNVVAFLARADVALSVSMTIFSTLMAVFLTPLLTEFYAGQYVPVDAWGLFKSILLIVVFPVIVGLLANRFFRKASQVISIYSPFVSVLCIILIVGFIMADKKAEILDHWKVLTAAVVLLHAGGFGLGYALAKLTGFEESVRRTASIEVGMQNSGLGAALAKDHFKSLPMAPVPCALSAVTHCILGSLVAGLWRTKPKVMPVTKSD
ncbi:MAG: transporter [Opitutales bacterium]|nr:transporter [Opitutales bacterium]